MAEEFKDGLEHLPLSERLTLRADTVADLAAQVTGGIAPRVQLQEVSEEYQSFREDIAAALGVSADPDDLVEAVRSERFSRQAWAEEALRLQETAAADPWGCDECMDADPEARLCDACCRQFTFCSCVTDERAAALVEAGFTRPQCTVHPEGGAQ